MGTIQSQDFASEMMDILTKYGDDGAEAIDKVIDEVSKDVANKLHEKNHGRTDWKKYPKGWKVKKETTRTTQKGIVYNAKSYQLTHLLEFDHALRGGGRKSTAAFPHIAEVNDWAADEFQKKIGEAINDL